MKLFYLHFHFTEFNNPEIFVGKICENFVHNFSNNPVGAKVCNLKRTTREYELRTFLKKVFFTKDINYIDKSPCK